MDSHSKFIEAARALDCIELNCVPIQSKAFHLANECHTNCFQHVLSNSSQWLIGYKLFVKDNIVHCIRHSIVRHNNTLIDLTPDNDYIFSVFALSAEQVADYKYSYCQYNTLVKSLVIMNKQGDVMGDLDKMYYVYKLIDPRDGCVFYVGKGSGNRIFNHVKNAQKNNDENKRKMYKIQSIMKQGLLPVVEYVQQNIESELEAYNIEMLTICKYGRKGYETKLH